MVTIEGIRTVVIECGCREWMAPEGIPWTHCRRCHQMPVYKRGDDGIQRHVMDEADAYALAA